MTKLEEAARDGLLYNFNATGGRYICPAWPHYPWEWPWDSYKHVIICAYLAQFDPQMMDLAQNEITRILSVQVREGPRKGFIPHQIYWPKVKGFNKRGFMDFERLFFRGWMELTSPLPAQPVLAQAARAIGDKRFFLEHADEIVDFYKYCADVLDPDYDGLISIFSPRAGGRDASPEWDFFRPLGIRFPREFHFLNSSIDFISLILLYARYKLFYGWDERKILESGIFDVQDLVMQCLYIDGLYDLVWMLENWDGSCKRYPEIKATIGMAEKSVLEKCWNNEDQTFYSLRNGSKQLQDLTVASVMPLAIKNLPEDKLSAILGLLRDKKKFATKLPVPSVSADHPQFDASGDWPLWRGGVWQNMNFFIIKWLLRHDQRDLAWDIAWPNIEVAEKDLAEGRDPFPEFRNPHTGAGLRNASRPAGWRKWLKPFDQFKMRVSNFGWSKLVVVNKALFEEYDKTH